MPPRLRTTMTTGLIGFALAAGVPAAAHAERVVTDDAAGDAVLVHYGEPGAEPQTGPAPHHAAVDVTRTVVAHGPERLRVNVRFRDLEATPWHVTAIRLRTPARSFRIEVDRSGSRPRGQAVLLGGGRVDCAGLRWSFAPDRDLVAVSLPAACVGTPRWVQVGAGALSMDESTGDPLFVSAFADDGNRPGSVEERLRLGPRVSRG